MKTKLGLLLPSITLAACTATAQAESIARTWNEQNLDAIRIDFPAPTVHARNLFHTSIAMWDAWAAYDPTSLGYMHRESASATDIAAARDEAVSYAAFAILYDRYLLSTNAETTIDALRTKMFDLGYDPDYDILTGDSPAAVGNRVAEAILDYYSNDGSNQENTYIDDTYRPRNDPLILENPGTTMLAPNRWQPLAFDTAQTQNGQIADKVQIFVGSHWGDVRPFAMSLPPAESVYFDPGLPPQFGGERDAEFKAANLLVLRRSRDLDPTRPEMIDISPRSIGNNTLGANDGSGYESNPVSGDPYVATPVPLGDYGRVIAEFWADGPDSETPPGHWNTLANSITGHPDFEPRIGGVGPLLSELEWDVKMYFALNGALHDTAIAVWGCKRAYDYVRPISSIRYLASQGALPLEPGLVEVVSVASSLPGGDHEGLTPGKIAVLAWGGEPTNPLTEFTGAKWIHAADWLPYQRDTFVTPAFAGYISGHSGFSRAAAEVLTKMTGSPYFPGGLGTFTASANSFLAFEKGPSVEVVLQWATYYDAADEAGISRIYGGIHVPADDGPGRIVGSRCGIAAFELASQYFDSSILSEPISMEVQSTTDGQYHLSWTARRGLNYVLDFSSDLSFWSPVFLPAVAEDSLMHQAYNHKDTFFPAPVFFRVRQIP